MPAFETIVHEMRREKVDCGVKSPVRAVLAVITPLTVRYYLQSRQNHCTTKVINAKEDVSHCAERFLYLF